MDIIREEWETKIKILKLLCESKSLIERTFFVESTDILLEEYGEFKVVKNEIQNQAYEGLLINTIEDTLIRSRLGKKTPKKPGYFVAFWEKDESNKNQPFKVTNSPQELAIIILDKGCAGIFRIPKKAAIKHGILTSQNQKGKMAMRFYPPWCHKLNRTAQATQKWQLNYFKYYTE